MNIDKSVVITFDSKQDIRIMRGLVRLGLTSLEDVNKESWGEKLEEYKKWGELFLKETSLNSNSDHSW